MAATCTAVEEFVEYDARTHAGAANGVANGSDYDVGRVEYDVASALIIYEEYNPYGTSAYRAVDSTIQVSAKRYRYAAAERDEETGLDHMGLRYYAPWLGRWTSADPIGISGDINLYEYARSNPVAYRDPSGQEPQLEIDKYTVPVAEPDQGPSQIVVEPIEVIGDVPQEVSREAAGVAGVGTTGQMEFTPGELDIAIGIEATIAELEQEAADTEGELPSYSEVAANILVQLPFQPVLGLLEIAGPGEAERVEEVRQELRPFPYDPNFLDAGSALEQGLIALGSLGVPGGSGGAPRGTPKVPSRTSAPRVPGPAGPPAEAATPTLQLPKPVGADVKTARVRHFTAVSRLEAIEESGVLLAGDKGSVFTVRAKGKPGSPRDVERALGIDTGRGGGIVEFDAALTEFEIVKNPVTGAREFVFKGNVDLSGRNPTFRRNR